MWLKLNTYYKHPLITECCDKYRVRDYVKRMGCEEMLNDLIGVWNNPDEINFDKLPNKFVLKCNHGAGYNIICDDKTQLDIEMVKRQLKIWMRENYWKLYAETQYKFIHKKIICEHYIETENDDWPDDYKFFCINGRCDCVMICKERKTGETKFYYFDRSLQYHPEYFYITPTEEEKILPEEILYPQNIEEMFRFAEILAKPFPFVRVDLYNEKGKIIFGELTFVSSGGIDNDGYATTTSAVDITMPVRQVENHAQ